MNIFCSHKNHTITLRSQIVLLLQLPSPHCWANIDWARARKLIPRLHSSSNSTTRCHILRPSRFGLQTTRASTADNVLSSFFSPDLLPRFYVEEVTLSTQFISQAWCTVTLLLMGKIKKTFRQLRKVEPDIRINISTNYSTNSDTASSTNKSRGYVKA